MRTREKTNAQLVKELAATKELVQDRDAQLQVLRKDSDALRELQVKYEGAMKDLHHRDAQMIDLSKEMHELSTQLGQAHHDREFYSRWSERSDRELTETRDALRTLAQATGRIGKADEPRTMSMTDQNR